MRIKWLFFSVVIVLFSCKEKISRKQQIETYLTGGNQKYWTYMKEYPIKRHQGRLFKSNGTYIDYFVQDFKETGVRCFSKNYEKPIWEIKGEDTLCISGFAYSKIEYINDDVLILSYFKREEGISVWYKAKDQETKIIADTTNYLYPDL